MAQSRKSSLRPTLWLLAAALLLAVAPTGDAAPAAGAEGWTRVAPDDHPFAARLPADPEVRESSRWTPLGRIASRGYRHYRETEGCDMVAAELPALVGALAGTERLYQMSRDNLLAEANGEALSYEDWERDGVTGKRLEWSGEGSFGRAEFYHLAGHLYVFSCFARGDAPTPLIENFFARLSVWKP